MVDRDTDDRRLDELLSELRVVLPGATVLFAFLLTLPFTARSRELTDVQEAAYVVSFLTSAMSIVLLVAEVAYHRLRGRPYDKALMVRTVTRQAVAAVGLLGVSLLAAVYLVLDVIYSGVVAAPVTAAVGALAAVTWVGVPLSRRQDGR